MSSAEKIFQEALRLPEPLAQEVLDFIAFLSSRHGVPDEGGELLKSAQRTAMERVWANSDDDVWNAL